jgi:hypothetical protein
VSLPTSRAVCKARRRPLMTFTNVTKLVTKKSVILLQSSLSGGRNFSVSLPIAIWQATVLSPRPNPSSAAALSALRRLPRSGVERDCPAESFHNQSARSVWPRWTGAGFSTSNPLCDLSEAPDLFLQPFQAYAHKTDPTRESFLEGLEKAGLA